MNYDNINDIFDIENDKIEYIQKDNNKIIGKVTKYLNIGQEIKTSLKILQYYNYILFKTKYKYLYFDGNIIHNNLIINTKQDIINIDKNYIIIKYKPKSDYPKESYYNQKVKLEMYLYKTSDINYSLLIKRNYRTMIHNYFNTYIFIKYIETSKKLDKKYITINNNNFIIIYKIDTIIDNYYNIYLYKIKNRNNYDEIIIDINYDDIKNIFDNFNKYSNLINKFLDEDTIIHDNVQQYFGNFISNIVHVKYLELQIIHNAY